MANRLFVQLLGVCVHLGEASGITFPTGVNHRVVYPAGFPPFIGGVEPHAPTIKIVSGPTVVLSERSITNSIVTFSSGATTSGVSGTFSCVPHLQEFFPWFTPDPNKVTGQPLAGFAFVDFTDAVFSGLQSDGAANTQAIIDYPDTVPTVSVTITPPIGEPYTCNNIALPATVIFDSDADNHLLDDYFVTLLVASPVSTAPENVTEEVNVVINFVNTCLGGEGDAGCSNSQYP